MASSSTAPIEATVHSAGDAQTWPVPIMVKLAASQRAWPMISGQTVPTARYSSQAAMIQGHGEDCGEVGRVVHVDAEP